MNTKIAIPISMSLGSPFHTDSRFSHVTYFDQCDNSNYDPSRDLKCIMHCAFSLSLSLSRSVSLSLPSSLSSETCDHDYVNEPGLYC